MFSYSELVNELSMIVEWVTGTYIDLWYDKDVIKKDQIVEVYDKGLQIDGRD